MLADAWRAAMAVADFRRAGRLLRDKPRLDVVFVTNLRDQAERERFFSRRARTGAHHAAGPRMHLRGVAAQVRGINITAEEMLSRDGRRQARALFIEAVEWAQRQGARVVLLAASTKRLFGRDGAELKARFPNITFTIGDNGTATLLCQDIDRAVHRAALRKPRVLVVGPYGILGSAVTRHLMDQGHDVIGWGASAKLLADHAAATGMPIVHHLAEVGAVDLVITCTHSAEAKLTPETVELLRRPSRKLLVVDVAEPANLDAEAYAQCADRVVRQDAGNAHAAALHYVLGPLSWRKLHLSRGCVFGCFAEAMALFHAAHREHNPTLLTRDWFEVSEFNTALVREAFTSLGLGLPQPHCFGQPVRQFDLALPAPSSQLQTVVA